MTTEYQCGPGLAALSICESLLLALGERSVLDQAEIRGLLEDAAMAQIEAASEAAGDQSHNVAVALIERMMKGRNTNPG